MTKFARPAPIVAATAAALILSAGAAAALSIGAPLGQDADSVRAALEAEGYEVLEIEVEGDEIEAEVLKDGQELEIEVSVQDGLVTEIELEDEDGDDD